MEAAVVTLLACVVVVLGLRWLQRPHTAVRLHEGRAEVQRGSPPRGLVADLSDIARAAPGTDSTVLLSGAGDKTRIELQGVDDEGLAQRVRNVVRMHQQRIR
jgi:hypothetical protein